VKKNLRPQSAKRQDILTAFGDDDPNSILQYLVKQSSLIQVMGVTKNSYRFTIEVLAEHLAAMHLVDSCDGNEEAWTRLQQKVEKMPGAPDNALSFLRAVEDYCDLNPGRIPDSVLKKLRKWTGSSV
jgi:hypothetical protein